jgi:hypothetical protein
VCSESEECDTCMSVLTTLKTMQEKAIPEYNCQTMIFTKACKSACLNAKQEMIHVKELASFRAGSQDTCSACFRIGHCHLQTCED